MLNYKQFLNEYLFENLINETILYFQKDFKELLKSIDSPISKDILNMSAKETGKNITFLTTSDNIGYVDFNTDRNVEKAIRKKYDDEDGANYTIDMFKSGDLEYWVDVLLNQNDGALGEDLEKSKNSIKIGKLINKLFPGKYDSNQIEEFTNKFKASIKDAKEDFEEVTGEDIRKWYLEDNYMGKTGSLGSSCMRYKSCQGFFDIYVRNPEVCKMLILKKQDKLIARALVWKVKTIKIFDEKDVFENIWFMDRQYTSSDYYDNKLVKYAKERGWAYKTHNRANSIDVTYNDNNYRHAKMTIELNADTFEKFPYMDTFSVFDPHECKLFTHDSLATNENDIYILRNTSGMATDVNGNYIGDVGDYSEYYDAFIPEEDSLWSDHLGTYIYRHLSVIISLGVNDVLPDDHEDVAYCIFENEYALVEDCVWSDNYGGWIYVDNAATAYHIDSDGMIIPDGYYHMDDGDNVVDTYYLKDYDWYKFFCNKKSLFSQIKSMTKQFLKLNYENKEIPISLERKVYKVTTPSAASPVNLGGFEYLSIEDAVVLGWNLSKESISIDIVEYNKKLGNRILNKIQKSIGSAIKSYEDDKIGKGQQNLFDMDLSRKSNIINLMKSRKNELDSELFHRNRWK